MIRTYATHVTVHQVRSSAPKSARFGSVIRTTCNNKILYQQAAICQKKSLTWRDTWEDSTIAERVVVIDLLHREKCH